MVRLVPNPNATERVISVPVAKTYDPKPAKCRLTQAEWEKYLDACQRGNLFFYRGVSLVGALNFCYQKWILKKKTKFQPTHVGVIGDERFAYEALFFDGLTRNESVDRYLNGSGRLMIGRLKAQPTPAEVQQGILCLLRAMREKKIRYDWISLISLGLVQSNGRMICSEAVQEYMKGTLQYRNDFVLRPAEFVLPWQFVPYVDVLWEG